MVADAREYERETRSTTYSDCPATLLRGLRIMPKVRGRRRPQPRRRLLPEERLVEKRATIRHRVLKAGTIEFDGGAVNCIVRNMTDLGAMLDVASPIGIPDRFTLALQTDRLRKYCRTVWWNENRIGVAFD